jgi:hypothetical protein
MKQTNLGRNRPVNVILLKGALMEIEHTQGIDQGRVCWMLSGMSRAILSGFEDKCFSE